jgi:hypothetical protein
MIGPSGSHSKHKMATTCPGPRNEAPTMVYTLTAAIAAVSFGTETSYR